MPFSLFVTSWEGVWETGLQLFGFPDDMTFCLICSKCGNSHLTLGGRLMAGCYFAFCTFKCIKNACKGNWLHICIHIMNGKL